MPLKLFLTVCNLFSANPNKTSILTTLLSTLQGTFPPYKKTQMPPNPILGTAKEQVQIHEPMGFRDDWKYKSRG